MDGFVAGGKGDLLVEAFVVGCCEDAYAGRVGGV